MWLVYGAKFKAQLQATPMSEFNFVQLPVRVVTELTTQRSLDSATTLAASGACWSTVGDRVIHDRDGEYVRDIPEAMLMWALYVAYLIVEMEPKDPKNAKNYFGACESRLHLHKGFCNTCDHAV
jgi:hypothetical protein